ncbi:MULTISPECIES: phosphodiesterase [Serratia]|uniref:phosphodiesterase n=1 Tax=Serratia TaxID=613 RepID=UPI002A59AA8A|nr:MULTISPECIES: phosphodiesterase [Serratia]MDY0768499.1 phosphodiesterase [Serratia nevei]MED6027236.1 phosphodiesterase [Serratia marcescens]
MKTEFLLAQISDLHIKAAGQLSYNKVDTLSALQAAVAHLNALRPAPDAVVITGDLTDFGRANEYQQVRKVLDRLTRPWFAIPGNHDDRATFRNAFGDCPWLPAQGEFLNWTIDDFPLRLIGLDSTVPGYSWGEICESRAEWLRDTLAEQPHKPTVLMLHHHPFICGIDHMDRQNLRNRARLASVLVDAPQVKLILCGHVHRFIVSQLAGVMVCSAPGTSHQVVPDFTPDGPANFVLEPPGMLLHLWKKHQGLSTHYLPIGQYDGPWPFYDKDGLID